MLKEGIEKRSKMFKFIDSKENMLENMNMIADHQ